MARAARVFFTQPIVVCAARTATTQPMARGTVPSVPGTRPPARHARRRRGSNWGVHP